MSRAIGNMKTPQDESIATTFTQELPQECRVEKKAEASILG